MRRRYSREKMEERRNSEENKVKPKSMLCLRARLHGVHGHTAEHVQPGNASRMMTEDLWEANSGEESNLAPVSHPHQYHAHSARVFLQPPAGAWHYGGLPCRFQVVLVNSTEPEPISRLSTSPSGHLDLSPRPRRWGKNYQCYRGLFC